MGISPGIENLIRDATLSAHIATTVNDRPHVAPVWYVYDDGLIWILTGGKKLQNVKRNPRVALSIEKYDEDGVDWSAQLLGTARTVEDDTLVKEIRNRMNDKYSGPYGTDGGEDGYGWALIEIEIGSATSQSY